MNKHLLTLLLMLGGLAIIAWVAGWLMALGIYIFAEGLNRAISTNVVDVAQVDIEALSELAVENYNKRHKGAA